MLTEYVKWTTGNCPIDLPENVVVRWVFDDEYNSVGSYAYDTEEETRAAEQAELKMLETGALVALGCIVEDNAGHQIDSLWGIVIESDERKLAEFFEHSMEVPSGIEVAEAGLARAQEAVKAAHEDLIQAHIAEARKGR